MMFTLETIERAKALTYEQYENAIITCVDSIQEDAIELMSIKNHRDGKSKLVSSNDGVEVFKVRVDYDTTVFISISKGKHTVEW